MWVQITRLTSTALQRLIALRYDQLMEKKVRGKYFQIFLFLWLAETSTQSFFTSKYLFLLLPEPRISFYLKCLAAKKNRRKLI
jgi:hypothetical protein